MLIQASNLYGQPIITDENKEQVGRVSGIIIDPENGRVLAFMSNTLFQKPRVVAEQDVLDITRAGIIINDARAMISPSEIIKVEKVIKKKIQILGSSTITESKKKLGIVEDFVIETDTATIIKFYIKGGVFAPSLILSSDNVIKIIPGKIIFSNDVLEQGKAEQESMAA